MQVALENAGKKLGDALLTFGKHYLSCAVTAGLKPVIKAAIVDLLEETKKEVGMKVEEKEDKLGDGKGAEQAPLFGMELDSVRAIHTGWNFTFTSYTLYCMRVGFNTKGDFYALGAKYEVRYNILTNMYDKLKKEIPDTKVGPVPPDCKHGQYCCCLEYKPDMEGSQTTMKNYLHGLAIAHPTSKSLPTYYYLGDDYELQQRAFVVFEAAFAATKAELVKGEFHRDLTPFDEGEALNSLLQQIARQDVLAEVRENVMKLPGGMCEYRMTHAADMAVLTAIDSAMAVGWPQAQDVVNKGKLQVQKAIDAGAEKLVEALKPVLKKILTLVQSKLNKKEEKEDKEDNKKKASRCKRVHQRRKSLYSAPRRRRKARRKRRKELKKFLYTKVPDPNRNQPLQHRASIQAVVHLPLHRLLHMQDHLHRQSHHPRPRKWPADSLDS